MDKPELTLNFLKILIWPVLIAVVLFSFHAEIEGLLGGEFEMEIFGVKIRGRKNSGVEQLEKKANQLDEALSAAQTKLAEQNTTNRKLREENADLRKAVEEQNQEIENAKASGIVTAIKPLSVTSEKSKELAAESQRLTAAIQADLDRAQDIVGGTKLKTARENESEGFKDLLADRFDDAIRCFEAAYKAYPDYHNVDEIRRLLRRNLNNLQDPSTRDRTKKEVYGQILGKYKWGMPEFAKKEMSQFLGS